MSSAFHHHPHWTAVTKAIDVIQKAGFRALLAGGCVRDLIMNRTPNDFDIATDATPDQLKPLFPRALEVGREFGVTILPEDGFQLEIATFRKDGPYLDGRRPSSIEFSSPEEDAARRDFTVNALFYDITKDQILDFIQGQADIKKRVIRTVGEPERRFEEDKLRLVRAVRFAAQLDFEIAPETFASVTSLAPTLKVVSRERVRDEMQKLMKSPGRARGLQLLFDSKLLWEILPQFPRDLKVESHVQKSWNATSELTVLWALLLKYSFKSESDWKKWLKHLIFPTQQTNAITWILKNSEGLARPQALKLASLIRLLANDHSQAALQLHEVDAGPLLKEDAKFIHQVRESYLINNISLPAAWVNGADLQALGMRPGPEMGKTLEQAYDDQLEQKFSSRDELLVALKNSNKAGG